MKLKFLSRNSQENVHKKLDKNRIKKRSGLHEVEKSERNRSNHIIRYLMRG